MGLLDGRVALVSGIGPGLGREVALALAREGADLVIGARTESRLAEVAKQVEGLGRRVAAVRTDVTRDDDCARAAEAARELGGLDVLVNNAYHEGVFASIEQSELADWRAPFETNVLGTLRLTRALLPLLRARGGGSVVMVNSMIVRRPLPTMAGYAASKGALLAATQTLARELGRDHIRVNSVHPGYIWGPALQGYFEAQARSRGVDPQIPYDEVAAEIALGRIPEPAEIADAIVFLASDLSRAITGQSLDVNGWHVFH